ncbi:MAG: protein kinase [Planctomycetales bacterium]|nr:protein kinase [Planctomycetales bacterium]
MAELKTFLFTDICGSVRLKGEMTGRSVTERDMAFINTVLTPHRARIERDLAERGGRVVSTAGDGHFLVFGTTVEAALWAVGVQESHRDNPIETPSGEHVEVRISMHVGVPQVDPGDPNNFVGKSVDYAARLNDYATGAQILVSRSVMAILDDIGLEGLKLHLHGKRLLKGIGNVEVHELLYDDHGPRALRIQPKTGDARQWTVLPTMEMGDSETAQHGGVGVAARPGLKRVGNYELQELLGAGGMGDVYKARHSQFDRTRAVKVIKPQFLGSGHEDVVRRFYNEIKAVGKLEHKNIVVAIDSSAPTDQVHYLVMEYIDGVGLDELVAMHGPLAVPDACETVRQAARGLQYIHRNGMVHRDIKPSNLMLTLVDGDQIHSDSSVTQGADRERGVVKILDLGLALLAQEGQDRFTRFDNRAMGTGMYMSPEQWKTTSVDIRADIYSLGCSLYHLLAGHPPFAESDLRPEKAHEKSAVPPIRATVVPRKLWDVIRKMMAKAPEERFSDPAEVAAALAPFCEGHNLPALFHEFMDADGSYQSRITTQPSSQLETWRTRRWTTGSTLIPTRRWLLGTGVPLLLALTFAGGALYVLSESREAARQRAEAEARKDLPAKAKFGAHANLPKAISQRFDVLTKAAADPQLQQLVAQINATRADASLDDDAKREKLSTLMNDLEGWMKDFGYLNSDAVQADSLFVNDATGYQVARFPAGDSVGKNYQARDYFHGAGRNLTDPAEIAAATPTHEPHLSAVYRSTTTNNLKVAFSVPIFPAGTVDGEPEGVLAMSLNVAQFEVLEEGLSGAAEVVLIDLRPDSADEDTAEASEGGLILHHPRQTAGKRVRISDVWRDAIKQALPTEPGFRSEEHFLVGYEDPLAEPAGQKYWAAFEPVTFTYHNAATGEDQAVAPGWIVLAQKPMLQ